ncbi:putative transporter [Aspergillus aculeatinus CBS 121060]|uniref:Transporter n=1 Tax=Aspergillus aculeatinus CBS 121060 TaxID=1448322 RepID=A0ACD1GTC3_9EURO|nr:putative transporter [Aspergillus aculeatinus CBS 121060]RAH64568.1 putative transporter [Aspergillus aculeatinus CBS 121060]
MSEEHMLETFPSSGRADADIEETEDFAPPHHRPPNALLYAIFVGCFIASADEALMISTYTSIASEFQQLTLGSWLLVAYNCGSCVACPVIGALCDIYGRKKTLLGSYAVFIAGSFLCGVSGSLVTLAGSRVIAGVGGAGMVAMTSVIITDLIPPHEVALYDGYSSTINMLGRSVGPPLGGFLTQTVGWRLSFLGQIPFAVLCLVAMMWGKPPPLAHLDRQVHGEPKESHKKDIDVSGMLFLTFTVVALSALVEYVTAPDAEGQNAAVIFFLLVATLVAGVGFAVVEGFYATNPLLPVHLIKGPFGAWCLMELLIYIGRGALLTHLTPYLIRVEGWSDAWASFAFVGNVLGIASGGLAAGYAIKRYKRYRKLGISSHALTTLAYLLLFVEWRNGCTIWQAGLPSLLGLGTGLMYTVNFIGLATTSPKESMPACIGTIELCESLGFIVGPAISTAMIQKMFAYSLAMTMPRVPGLSETIHHILDDARFSFTLGDAIQQIARTSYLQAFQYVPLFATVCSGAALAIFMRTNTGDLLE